MAYSSIPPHIFYYKGSPARYVQMRGIDLIFHSEFFVIQHRKLDANFCKEKKRKKEKKEEAIFLILTVTLKYQVEKKIQKVD